MDPGRKLTKKVVNIGPEKMETGEYQRAGAKVQPKL
jgi:hypothetical protein